MTLLLFIVLDIHSIGALTCPDGLVSGPVEYYRVGNCPAVAYGSLGHRFS